MEAVIGFDVRSPLCTIEDNLVSIDPSLWDSLAERYYDELSSNQQLKLQFSKRSGLGINLPYWADLYELRDFIGSHSNESIEKYVFYAITAFEKEVEIKEDWPYLQDTVPSKICRDWKFMGYDIFIESDESVFASTPKKQISEDLLNEYSLFKDLTAANMYRDCQDFSASYILGLWELPIFKRCD